MELHSCEVHERQNSPVFSLAGKTGLECKGAQGDGDGFQFSSSESSVQVHSMVLFLPVGLTAMKVQKIEYSKVLKLSPKGDREKGLGFQSSLFFFSWGGVPSRAIVRLQ